MSLSVFMLCEQAIGLVRGKRLILTSDEREYLNALDYEGLTAVHAQDEAVVCALHFERVRDRLLQLYPWTFARKTANIEAGGYLPADCLSVLCVLVDGIPAEYEIISGRLNTLKRSEVHYTGKITDITQWSGIFSDVFAYSLAIEICSAVTGKPEYTQLLEQKAQEILQRAKQTGAIKAETRVTLKNELYNRAVMLARGQRTLKESSDAALQQGTDNAGFVNDRMTAEYQVCEHSGESVRNRLLELYPWQFARKTADLWQSASPAVGWKYGYKLPPDCLRVLAVIGRKNTLEYEQVGGNVYTNEEALTVRYTGLMVEAETWPGSFRDIFSYQLAIEVVYATSGKVEIIQLLEQKSLQVIQFAYNNGLIQNETNLPASEELYVRAVAIAHGSEEAGEDVTTRNARELSVCRRSSGYIRDRLLQSYPWKFARKTAKITQGTVPEDCLAILAVLVDGKPADGDILPDECEIEYTAKITEINQWSAIFKDAFSYLLAGEIIRSVKGNAELAQATEAKAEEYIRKGYELGVIKAETRLSLKDELFSRAIALARGQRLTSPSSEQSKAMGLDYTGNPNWRSEAEYQACVRSSETIRDKLLELHPWIFARKSVTLTPSCETVTGWEYGYDMPDDCLTVLTVLTECGNPTDYETAGRQLFTNSQAITIRYTAKVTEYSKWPSTFADAYVYLLACEVLTATIPLGEALQNMLLYIKKECDTAISECYRIGIIKSESNITLKDELCERAIGLLLGLSGNDNLVPEIRAQAYSSIRRAYDSIRDKVLQMYAWTFARKTASLPTKAHKVYGWRYTFELPPDCLRVNSVIAHDMRDDYGADIECMRLSEFPANVEIIDYEVSGTELYADREYVHVRYTARVTDKDKWPPLFREVLIYSLAAEAALNVPVNAEIHKILMEREKQAAETAIANGAIREETRLPLQHESRRTGLLNRQYLEYSGLPTIPCGYGVCRNASEFFIRRN